MVSLDQYISQLEAYPALPPEIHIEDLRIMVGDRIIDIREQIALSRDDKKKLESKTNLGRQKICDYSFDDGRETSIYVSKYDLATAKERAKFYDNHFHPHVGNVMLHDVPLRVERAAWQASQLWEREQKERSMADKLKNGKSGDQVGEMSQREIIRYTVYTRYANGSRCHAVLTEVAEFVYGFSLKKGSQRMLFKLNDIITDDKPVRARYTKNCIKDAEGREIVLDDNKLTIDIRALDMAEMAPAREKAAKAHQAPVFDAQAEPVFTAPDRSQSEGESNSYTNDGATNITAATMTAAAEIIAQEAPSQPINGNHANGSMNGAHTNAHESIIVEANGSPIAPEQASQPAREATHPQAETVLERNDDVAAPGETIDTIQGASCNGAFDMSAPYGIQLDDMPYKPAAPTQNGLNGHDAEEEVAAIAAETAEMQAAEAQATNPQSDPNSF
ncbi:MAG: hypothetical protein MRY32_04390 [Rickettsiales bacterium]|nr:hypothetical protein [Rickettsiales bacterium]